MRRLIVSTVAVVAALAAAAVLGFPGPAACAVIGMAGLQPAGDGVLTDDRSGANQRRYHELVHSARARIASTFGTPEGRPIVVFFNQPEGIGPFRLNAYGSTQMIGSRACVMLGPQGQNIDVVAHELVHGEIVHRTGYLRRFLQLPTWFDEGVAMQVDYRPRYDQTPQETLGAASVRALTSSPSFNDSDDGVLTHNYASAKTVFSWWRANVGGASLYPRLERLKHGEPFAEVFPESEFAARPQTSPTQGR